MHRIFILKKTDINIKKDWYKKIKIIKNKMLNNNSVRVYKLKLIYIRFLNKRLGLLFRIN